MEKDFVAKKIKEKFGTLRNYADYLGISEQNLNAKLSRLSSKFVRELEREGILKRIDYKENHKTQGLNVSGKNQFTHSLGLDIASIVHDAIEGYKKTIGILIEENKRLKQEIELLGNKNKKMKKPG